MSYTKGDSCKGTVTGTSYKGAFVRLDDTTDVGFCKCSLLPGDTAWFEVTGFTVNDKGTCVKLAFDSIISYGEYPVFGNIADEKYQAA